MGLRWTEGVGCVSGGRLGWRRESRDKIGFLGLAGQVVGYFSHCLGGRGMKSEYGACTGMKE